MKLSFTGGEGVNEFLRFSFEEANLLDEAVARAAGFKVSAGKDIDSVESAIEMTHRINERATKASGSGGE